MVKLIELQTKLLGQLSIQTIQMLLKLWSPYRNWTDYDLGVGIAARSATTVEAAVRQARMRERTFMKFVYKEMNIPFPKDSDIDNAGLKVVIPGGVDIYLRDGVTPLDVYQRPLEEFRYFESIGKKENEALALALQRVSTMADTDLTLGRREEARSIFEASDDKVIGYRRIIHPEQSQDGTSCGLCVVASTRLYHTSELMPIHDECNCDVLPVTLDADPGQQINEDDLALIIDETGSNIAGELLKTKVSFTEHGELGPIISTGNRAGSKQRKAAAKRPSLTPEESVNKELHTLRKSADKLEARLRKGEAGARQYLSWERDRIAVLERRLVSIRKNNQ
jgi:hypothetical protein